MAHSPTITVVYDSSGWQGKLTSAIQARNNIRIRIKGSKAAQVRIKVQAFTMSAVPSPPLPPVPVPFPNISVSTFLAALPTLLGLVLNALVYHGYSSIKAGFDANGSGHSDDEMLLYLA